MREEATIGQEKELEKICEHAEQVGIGSTYKCNAYFECTKVRKIENNKYCTNPK